MADRDGTSAQRELPPARGTLGEVAGVFLRLGFTAFGGPAAHIAMMRQELVQRRRWLPDARFLDLLGATNFIPGPNSTELAIHLGYLRAGWPGLLTAGSLFIMPAMLIVLALAWGYAAYGSVPQAQWLLYGIKPVIIAIVAQALVGLARSALKGPVLIATAAGVLALYLLGFNELVLLFGGGALALIALLLQKRLFPPPSVGPAAAPIFAWPLGASPAATIATTSAAGAAASAAAIPFSLSTLFLTFLKIGSVLYGSGYVLLAFLRGDFVERLGWLTDQQLLDAISIGQFTPGPVFTTATFVGYLVGSGGGQDAAGGIVAALLATLGIFLPSFVFVALSGPLVPRLRGWPLTALLLDGVNAAALGLMAAVTLELGRAALVDPLTIVLAVASLAVLVRWKVNSAWLVGGGGLIGIAYRLMVG
jgi:chromate transporter